MAAPSPKLPSSTAAMSSPTTHIVAVLLPARGHINPMLNLCSRLAASVDGILITIVITDDYLSLISPPPQHQNLRLRFIPSVSFHPEHTDNSSFIAEYYNAVLTNMEFHFDRLLDDLDLPITSILADCHLPCALAVGNRRGIPVSAIWMQTAAAFTVFHHFDLLASNHHLPSSLSGREEERVECIPGIGSATLADLHSHCFSQTLSPLMLHVFSWITKAQCILLNSCYELEPRVIETLRSNLLPPIYPIGPCIVPYTKPNKITDDYYFSWLDSHPKSSVLYVSFGTFLSIPREQMDEMALGLSDSGVRYLWAVRETHCQPRVRCNDSCLIVPWCEQMRVLCHPSVGGFLTHCGWNSTAEGLYAGVPMLAFPLLLDQFPNSKMIVDDWKVGLWMRRQGDGDCVVRRGEIARLVKTVMDPYGDVSREMRARAKDVQTACRRALEEDGSSGRNLGEFVKNHVA